MARRGEMCFAGCERSHAGRSLRGMAPRKAFPWARAILACVVAAVLVWGYFVTRDYQRASDRARGVIER